VTEVASLNESLSFERGTGSGAAGSDSMREAWNPARAARSEGAARANTEEEEEEEEEVAFAAAPPTEEDKAAAA
jgi:hypothetical protein